MDANGTRYQLLLGRDDWHWPPNAVTPAGFLAWDCHALGADVAAAPVSFRRAAGSAAAPRRAARGGRDRFGNWYWIGPNRDEILINASDSGTTTHFWSPTDPEGLRYPSAHSSRSNPIRHPADMTLSGLAVTEEHYLVVGTLAPAGLLVFDLHAGGPPLRLPWPSRAAFVPFDMAAAPGEASGSSTDRTPPTGHSTDDSRC